LPTWQPWLLLLTPVLGGLMLGALLAVQVHRNGHTTYYFVKLLLGYELVLAVLVPAVVALVVTQLVPPGGRRPVRIAVSVVVSLAATVCFGAVAPSRAALFDDTAPGTASVNPPYSRDGMAAGILAAARASDDASSFDTAYVALGPGAAGLLLYPDSWFHALHASVSDRVLARMELMRLKVGGAREAGPVVTAMLEQDPDLRILVTQQEAAALREALGPTWASHVVPVPQAVG
jgi:hypothetical protein